MIEELIHTPDGSLIGKDPWVPFLNISTRVRLIDASLAATVGCHMSNGALGRMSESCIDHNRSNKKYWEANSHGQFGNLRYKEIYVNWDSGDYYWCPMECLEVLD